MRAICSLSRLCKQPRRWEGLFCLPRLWSKPRQWGVISLLLFLAACAPALPPDDPGLVAVTLPPTAPASSTVPAPSPTPAPALVTRTPDRAACSDEMVTRLLREMPPYVPSVGEFVTARDGSLWVGDQPFVPRGINYYPALAPWHRFPTASLTTIERDFAQLAAADVNTVRLFIWHTPFFICPGSGAVPNPDAILWLDAVLRLAAAHGFRVILVLHDLPDLPTTPLYRDLGYVLAQTAYLVNRYRDEPALLAWDLRDAGDADYTPFSDDPAPFTRAEVLDWLGRAAAAVHQLDPNHLVTAGWASDSEGTISLVDVVSFQHFGDVASLRARIAALRALTDKPLLLIAVGVSSWQISEAEQAQQLRAVLRAAEADQLAGWLVWTMYDFPPSVTCYPDPCASLDDARHHFGLWRTDGARKPAANALETLAGS